MSAVRVSHLSKYYGKTAAVNDISFELEPGRIVGLIGPNGSGKTTTLKALLGLIPCEGELQVLGLDPRTQRDALMRDVSFVADVAILPRWLRVGDAVDFVAGVHPQFDRIKAQRYLANTKLSPKMKVKEMSKGMVAQLHLALVMAINAQLLVLDEPTLGLDVLYRKQFYHDLITDYFDDQKTVIISTHQVEEIEHILTDVMFLRDGRVSLHCSMDDMARRFAQVLVPPEQLAAAQALRPLNQQTLFGKTLMMFDGVPPEQLAPLGEVRCPALTDIFVTHMKGTYA